MEGTPNRIWVVPSSYWKYVGIWFFCCCCLFCLFCFVNKCLRQEGAIFLACYHFKFFYQCKPEISWKNKLGKRRAVQLLSWSRSWFWHGMSKCRKNLPSQHLIFHVRTASDSSYVSCNILSILLLLGISKYYRKGILYPCVNTDLYNSCQKLGNLIFNNNLATCL